MLIVEQGEGLWGAQRYLLRLAPLLEQRGFDQILAAPQESAITEAWRSGGRQHVHLHVPKERSVRMRGDEGRLSAWRVARELGRTSRNGVGIAGLATSVDADTIHANSHWSHLESVLAGRLAHRPVVLHLHEESLPGVASRLRGACVGSADQAVAVSHAVANCLPAKARARAMVIHNGVDTTAFSPGRADPSLRREIAADPAAPVVLVMCRLDPAKGVDHVIRAVAGLPAELERVQLAIAGTGSLRPEYAAQLHRLGEALLGTRVRFLGRREDAASLMRTADVLALGSSQEGLPLGILEAQACGLPVVAYPTAGVPEVIRHEVTGILADQGDSRSLSVCLARLLRDTSLGARIATAARIQMEASFSLERQADRQAALLARLAYGPTKGA